MAYLLHGGKNKKKIFLRQENKVFVTCTNQCFGFGFNTDRYSLLLDPDSDPGEPNHYIIFEIKKFKAGMKLFNVGTVHGSV